MAQNLQDSPVQALVRYLTKDSTAGCTRCLGLELEHFVVDLKQRRPVFYEDDAERATVGVATILQQLIPYYDQLVVSKLDGAGQPVICSVPATTPLGAARLIGLSRPSAAVSLEPGAQLEISLGPVQTLAELEALYLDFRAELDPILTRHGLTLLALGYQPFAAAADIPLIPKQRYRFMDRHFLQTGRQGRCMMRASASTQVSIDYVDEADALRKFRLVNALAPLFYFITDNAPIFEKVELTGYSGQQSPSQLPVPPRLVRAAIWADVDPWRCQLAPGSMSPAYCFAQYAKSLLAAPAIISEQTDASGGRTGCYEESRSFAEVFAGRTLTNQDVEHILSLFFFDNRFKNYIEVRAADSLPLPYALAYVALVDGLFYLPENLDWLDGRLAGLDATDVDEAKAALAEYGWSALVYDHPVADWLDGLVEHAAAGLIAAERPYLEPLAKLVAQRATLLDQHVAGQITLDGKSRRSNEEVGNDLAC